MFHTGVTFSLGGAPRDERGRVRVVPGESFPVTLWRFSAKELFSQRFGCGFPASADQWAPCGRFRKNHLSPINYWGFRRCWEEKHTFNLQVPLHVEVKQESLIDVWNFNWISPPAVSADQLMSFKQREGYRPRARRALSVQAMAAFGDPKHLELVKQGQIK